MTECSVADCVKPSEKRGWCSAHYSRWRKTGDVQAHVPLRVHGDLRAQFEEKVSQTPTCWLWTAAILPNGYGSLNVAKTPRLAHRVSYELYVGRIPDGMTIDHLCRVRHCVNPHHLEPVTRAENIRRGFAARRAS